MEWSTIHSKYFACYSELDKPFKAFSKELDARCDDLVVWFNTGRV